MLRRLSRAAFKPLYHLHYRWLYGRRFPGAATIQRAVERWERRWDRRDVPVSAERWDEEYAGGDWDFLHATSERRRYEALVAMLREVADRGGAILDIGCGDGVLLEHLPAAERERVIGIDLSGVAVDRARKRWPQARFEVANAEKWRPPGEGSAVLLNECLYYFHRPEATVSRYLDSLAPGGRLLISAVDSIRTRAILTRLEQVHGFAERREIREGNVLWHLAAIAR